MIDPAKRVLCYGRDMDLPSQTVLRAGPLSLLFENGSIRQIKLGNQIILQQIYAAVRNQNWETIEPAFSDVEIIQGEQAFQVGFLAQHVRREVDFSWRGAITGGADGTIVFNMDGVVNSSFLRNRIGFCVLHPASCAGLPCSVETVDGQVTDGYFPLYISPHQPFYNIRAITYEVIPGLRAEARMEGDTFEMEDQRNWTDASFKTYCTPLGVPYPVAVNKGERVSQTITLRLIGQPPVVEVDSHSLTIVIGDEESPLPEVGLGCASDGRPLRVREIERLRALNLAHLRLDLDLAKADFDQQLQRIGDEARQIGARLEIALKLSTNARSELEALARVIEAAKPPVARWLIFHQDEKSTSARWVSLAREMLADQTPDALFGGGTDAFFTELNRERPAAEVMDFVTFSTNPQVHALDNLSLTETLPVHRDLIESARQFAGQRPIIVSPVTFKMRWNPNATGADAPLGEGEIPTRVDVRQMSLFGAGWTLGNLKYLAEAGVRSVTYYETCGWYGVMETEEGSPAPHTFRSYPGGVFPMYHVFADVGLFAGGQVLHSISSDPTRVISLMLQRDGKRCLLVANLSAVQQTIQITGKGISGAFASRFLDETNGEMAMRQPEDFRMRAGETLYTSEKGLTVSLLPYALLRLDAVE